MWPHLAIHSVLVSVPFSVNNCRPQKLHMTLLQAIRLLRSSTWLDRAIVQPSEQYQPRHQLTLVNEKCHRSHIHNKLHCYWKGTPRLLKTFNEQCRSIGKIGSGTSPNGFNIPISTFVSNAHRYVVKQSPPPPTTFNACPCPTFRGWLFRHLPIRSPKQRRVVHIVGQLKKLYLKGSLPPCVGHMQLLAWAPRADFSELTHTFKSHENPIPSSSSHLDASNSKICPDRLSTRPQYHFTTL